MQKHFINLTNGIEAIEQYNLNITEIAFLRIQSCHCESHSFEKILLELDNNFLMFLALGVECIVYDYGSNSENSKAVNTGLEWIKFVLNKRWFGIDYISNLKNQNMTQYYYKFYEKLDKKTKKRIDYFKKFLKTDKLNITVKSSQTHNDGHLDYYIQTIHKFV